MARRIPPRHQNKPKLRLKVKIKKDDNVKIIAGRDRGKTGRVLQVDAVTGRVLVEGVSLVKRHTRPNPQKQIGAREFHRDFKRNGLDCGRRGYAGGVPGRRQSYDSDRQKGRRDVG
jgi:hypothetical protein